jgi:inorganic pyrophosphatase
VKLLGNNKIFQSYLGKKIHIIIDRSLGTKHPKWNFIYPINYGFIPDTLAADGEEIDAYLLGVFEPISDFTGICIAIIHRINDNDDKLIIVPENKDYTNDQIMALTEFQERFFKSTIIRPEFIK